MRPLLVLLSCAERGADPTGALDTLSRGDSASEAGSESAREPTRCQSIPRAASPPPEDGNDWFSADTTEEIEDAIAALPPCRSGRRDGRIDLENCCIDGICVGATYDEAIATGGEPDLCWGDPLGPDRASCSWFSLEIHMEFRNGVGVRGPWITKPYDGHTSSGAGLARSAACFVEELGNPDYLSLYEGEARAEETMRWYGNGIVVSFVDGEAVNLWMKWLSEW